MITMKVVHVASGCPWTAFCVLYREVTPFAMVFVGVFLNFVNGQGY